MEKHTKSLGEDDIADIVDPTIFSTPKIGPYCNIDHLKSFHAVIPSFKKKEIDLTNEFLNSLYVPIPQNKIELVNIHIYGGPGTGKSVLSRAIGFNIKKIYGDKCQCLECSFLPDAIPHINPIRPIIVISIDDPMGAANESGGSQDARLGMTSDIITARHTFNAIRHIYAKRVLLNRARKIYGSQLPDEVEKYIELYHDNRNKLKSILPMNLAHVGGILFTIWGPQLPTIDQTFHMGKHWNIYKGFSAMDEKRDATLRKTLGYSWASKLSQKEYSWRSKNNLDDQSWSVIENAFTREKGWLYLKPTENVFEPVDRGGKGFQEKIKVSTEKMDTWAKHIYENRGSLMPPYDPHAKKEDRNRSLSNFLKDTLKANINPQTFDELSPAYQIFLNSLINSKGKITELDDRILRYHSMNINERKSIESLAQELVPVIENEKMSPKMRNARAIIRDVARRKFPEHKELINKPSNFMRIYDHFLYLWRQYHPDEKADTVGKTRINKEDQKLIEHATKESRKDAVEFSVTEEELIQSIMRERRDYHDSGLIYMYSEGLGNNDILSNRQIYMISQDPKQRKKYGFKSEFISEESVKYKKKQVRGLMSFKLGAIFEEWLEKILLKGYCVPGMIDNVRYVIHGGEKERPDFILVHNDDTATVLAAKCYASPRSETLEKDEITPELKCYNDIMQKGKSATIKINEKKEIRIKDARIAIVYYNIKIPHMLVVYIYEHASDVPTNLTFPPSLANKQFFRKKRKEEE